MVKVVDLHLVAHFNIAVQLVDVEFDANAVANTTSANVPLSCLYQCSCHL